MPLLKTACLQNSIAISSESPKIPAGDRVAGHPTMNEGERNRLLITLNVAQWVGVSWA